MADTWTLITPAGPYVLNPTFAAPKYQPGGVDTSALQARPGRAFTRVGDGLPTPGPLVLTGRVWRDDRNQAAMVSEMNAIRAAVRACTSVTRSNRGGTYEYEGLSGGPPPEITPDGRGGWAVSIELWPGSAVPTFLPADDGSVAPDIRHLAFSRSNLVELPTLGPSAPQDGDLLVALWVDSSVAGDTLSEAATGWSFAGGAKSPFGGIVGNRNAQIAIAYRTWSAGDPIALEPFGAPSVNNTELYVWVLNGAQSVTAAFANGVAEPAITPSLATPVRNALLFAAYVYPRSSIAGGNAAPDVLPNPPFTHGGAIGSGFNNMMGRRRRGVVEGLAFGPYPASSYAGDAWVTALFAAHQVL